MLPSSGYKTKYRTFLYPEEGSIAETSVKTLKMTALILQFSN